MEVVVGSAGLLGRSSFRVFGTTAELLVDAPSLLDRARELLDKDLAAVDLVCSRFRPDSELSAVNRAEGRPVRVSGLFARYLETALAAAEETAGDVDPTCGATLIDLGYDRDFAELPPLDRRPVVTVRPVPGWRVVELDHERGTVRVPSGTVLDLGATAKALAADRAAAMLHRSLGCAALVNLGGDIAVAGGAPPGGWRVEIDDGPPQTVAVTDGGVATSGTTARHWSRAGQTIHHIVSPGAAVSAPEYWRSVTVAAATCTGANVAATAAVVRGAAALSWLDLSGMPARLVHVDGWVAHTNAWPGGGSPVKDSHAPEPDNGRATGLEESNGPAR
jgi:thiamine biosynthesis lipoprotein